MAKIKPSDAGKFVTVYFDGEGKMDAVLLEVQDDVAEIWLPHLASDRGGVGCRTLVETADITAVGPLVAVHVPRF
jgi:hypothetical protein